MWWQALRLLRPLHGLCTVKAASEASETDRCTAAVSLGTAAVKPPAAAGHVEPLTRSASLLLPDSSKSFLGLVSWGICFGSR